MSILKPQIDSAIHQKCIEEGLAKRKYFYLKETREDSFYGLIGFGSSTHTNLRCISVHVGIYNVLIEKIYKTLANHKLSFPFWLFIINIGYLEPMKRFREWEFYESTDIRRTCDAMFEEIHEYAYPFIEKNANIESLINIYEKRLYPIGNDVRFLVQPLLYLHEGDKEKGKLLMEKMLVEGYHADDSKTMFYNNYCAF